VHREADVVVIDAQEVHARLVQFLAQLFKFRVHGLIGSGQGNQQADHTHHCGEIAATGMRRNAGQRLP
jgi:hypothetical protein